MRGISKSIALISNLSEDSSLLESALPDRGSLREEDFTPISASRRYVDKDLPSSFWSSKDLGFVESQSHLELVLVFCRQLGDIEHYLGPRFNSRGSYSFVPFREPFALRGASCGRLT